MKIGQGMEHSLFAQRTDRMTAKAYRFNKDAGYRAGGVFHLQPEVDLCHSAIRVSAIPVDNRAEFLATFPDMFSHYRLPYVESDKLVLVWSSNPMQFWQNQLNFAV